MGNVFISELNEKALKKTPTDVMANRLRTQASLGAAGLVAVEDDASLVFIAATLLTLTGPGTPRS